MRDSFAGQSTIPNLSSSKQLQPLRRAMSVPNPSKASDPESLFLSCLPHISRVAGILGDRYGLSDADVEEFGSWAKAKLIESEYAAFRKFAGRSSLNTYVSVVLTNLFKDFRNSRWGRWRPSAAAKRLGPLAVRFETMVYRDGHPTREAVALLKATGASEVELRDLAARIPPRSPVREVSLETALGSAVASDQTDLSLHDSEAEAEQTHLARIVRSALSELSPEDQVIVRMRFWEDASVADIARALRLDQKPLYRRLEAIQMALAAGLERHGATRDRISVLLSREGEN